MVMKMLNDILNTNFNEVLNVCQRALISLVLLFFITKLIGKKQVSELSLFDYVISISIGNFAAEISMNLDYQIANGLVAVLIFGIIAWIVAYLTMKSIFLRRFFMGSPTIIIQDGKFVYKNLKRLKMDINDFLETARIKGYFDISKVKYAIMEANGKVSFLLKEEENPVSIKDAKLTPKKEGLQANVIIDGKIMHKNLKVIKKDENWLLKQLKVIGKKRLDDILLATVDNVTDKLSIYEKNASIEIKNSLE